jgi:phospholipase C
LNDTEQNPDANGTPVVVWNSPGTDETTMRIPNPDPGELWTDINMQLFGNSAPAPGQRPTMVGFDRLLGMAILVLRGAQIA